MSRIFVSWSIPDADGVRPLLARLRGLGLDSELWEFEENMPGGVTIDAHVAGVLEETDRVVLCFSDETVGRPWIVREAEWCLLKRLERKRSGGDLHILPVWVGPHPEKKLPEAVKTMSLSTRNLADFADAEFESFLKDLLGNAAPRVVPAALFAMNRQQLQDLFNPQPPETLTGLCRAFGMPAEPSDLLRSLENRYGGQPEELSPFLPGEPLLDIIQKVLRKANEARVGDQPERHPIHLRWTETSRLVGPGSEQQVRDEWQSKDSLLVVDSISAFHPEIQAQLVDLPELARTALLWVPPYTQHTAAQEQALRSTAAIVRRFGDIFGTWEREPRRAITFDTTTMVSLRLWLHRTLYGIPDEAGPDLKRIQSVQGAAPSAFRSAPAPGSFWK